MTDLGSKNPLQLAHFEYQDAKIFGTKVWDGSLDFNLSENVVAKIVQPICFKGPLYDSELHDFLKY